MRSTRARLEELIRGEAAERSDDHLLDPCDRPRRAAVRADRDHRQGQGRVRRPGRRGARPAAPDRPAAHARERRAVALGASRPMPGARASEWVFELPTSGPEPLLKALIDGGAGIEALAIERPGLHDAFVAIAGEAAAAAMAEEKRPMMQLLRWAFVIARRDFSATVLSKTFLFFLLGPLFPLLFGAFSAGSAPASPSRGRAAGRGRGRLASRLRPARGGARAVDRGDRRSGPRRSAGAVRRGAGSRRAAEAVARDRTTRRSRRCSTWLGQPQLDRRARQRDADRRTAPADPGRRRGRTRAAAASSVTRTQSSFRARCAATGRRPARSAR